MGGIGAGGGGSAGQVDYPAHIKSFHAGLLSGDVDASSFDYQTQFTAAINFLDEVAYAQRGGTGGDPYASATAYDPSTDLGNIQTNHDALDTLLSGLDSATDVAAYISAAVTAAASLLPDSEIDDAVDAFEARSMPAFQRQVGAMTAGAFDIRATMSTQMDMAVANMEQDRSVQVDDFDARARLLNQQERYQSKIQMAEMMLRYFELQLRMTAQSTAQQFDISKLKIVAKQDEIVANIGFDERSSLWDLELLKYGQNALSSISGSVVPKAPTQQERLVAAVANSGAAGLQIGTALGNPAAGFLGGFGFLALQLVGGI